MNTITFILLYITCSAFITNWILDNIYKRCENPHYQVQAYNPIIFMLCVITGWVIVIPISFSVLLLALVNKFSFNKAFEILAKKLEEDK